METTIKKHGNSLVVVLPSYYIKMYGYVVGEKVRFRMSRIKKELKK